MRKNTPRDICFITGINEGYFLLCGMLMESLDRHFPLVPLHVMDFGLSDPQREFFRRLGMLLPLPAGLNRDDHPYKLKGAMRDYLDESLGAPIWIDADIIALRDGTAELHARWDEMDAAGQDFALTGAYGRPDGLAETLEFVTAAQHMPRLSAFVRTNPALGQRAYVNAALIFFRHIDVISGWRAASEAYEGDACWEQNALNGMLDEHLSQALLLDARIWNMHGSLIDQLSGDVGNLLCGGERTIFAHAASPILGHLDEGVMDFNFGAHSYRNFVKLFHHAALRELQMEYLTAFIHNHRELLDSLGIVQRA